MQLRERNESDISRSWIRRAKQHIWSWAIGIVILGASVESEVRQFGDLPGYGKRSASQGHAEKCSISSIPCVWSIGIVFPFHSEDEIVAQKNLEETWAVVGWRVVAKRLDNFQGLGIGNESDEWDGYQKKVFIGKCWGRLASFRRCLLGNHVHSSLLSTSTYCERLPM